MADKIASLSKTKSKEKEDERQEIYIHNTRKKRTNYWWPEIVLIPYKNGIPKNDNLARYNIW